MEIFYERRKPQKPNILDLAPKFEVAIGSHFSELRSNFICTPQRKNNNSDRSFSPELGDFQKYLQYARV